MPHESLPCTPPEAFQPLLEFLHTTTEVALVAGVAIGALSIIVGALFIAAPGQDSNQTGRRIIKNGIIGTVLLLSSQMIVAFLVTQLGSSLC